MSRKSLLTDHKYRIQGDLFQFYKGIRYNLPVAFNGRLDSFFSIFLDIPVANEFRKIVFWILGDKTIVVMRCKFKINWGLISCHIRDVMECPFVKLNGNYFCDDGIRTLYHE